MAIEALRPQARITWGKNSSVLFPEEHTTQVVGIEAQRCPDCYTDGTYNYSRVGIQWYAEKQGQKCPVAFWLLEELGTNYRKLINF